MNVLLPRHLRLGLVLAPILLTSACSSLDTLHGEDALTQEALRGAGDVPPPSTATTTKAQAPTKPREDTRQQIVSGGQSFVKPLHVAGAEHTTAKGDIDFDFQDQPIEAVVNTVLGDLLHVNYTISPDVDGKVSFSTAHPVSKQQALAILETLLSWNKAALVKQGGTYLVVPRDKAIQGQIMPQLPLHAPRQGLSVRIFPLKYISAEEMAKLLKPYAREDSILQTDNARNILILAGTPQELENYDQAIDTFDVNWLKGMSIGVFALEHASVKELMPQIRDVFGAHSDTPIAGLVKFMPVERTNSIVAISPQADYLKDIGHWIRTIDNGGGNEPQLFIYDVCNMKASELASYLQQIYGNSNGNSAATSNAANVAPGLQSETLSSSGNDDDLSTTSSLQGTTSVAAAAGGQDSDDSMDAETGNGSTSDGTNQATVTGYSAQLGDIRIVAQNSSNQLMVRARPSQWQEIESAIQRIDMPPKQVQIEVRILQVDLSGGLEQGVQWYLGRLAGNSSSSSDVADTAGHQGALGGGGSGLGSTDAFYYSFVGSKVQVALHALESSSRTQVLSAPSLVVLNNQKARIQVGDNVPITQTSVSTTSTATTSSVEYVQTGVILNVTPRVSPSGRIYMDVNQQVSDANSTSSSDENPTISTRTIKTQIAVRNGQTVLLGGLIKQENADSSDGVPVLSDIPGLGWLFKSRSKSRDRTEMIVLLTPRIIANDDDAAQITADYRQQMQLMQAKAAD